MIPEIELEHRSFEEMIQEYRQTIANLYPEWTNFNPHDPGMTILELFVWMQSVHTFEMDQITDAHRKKYLKLLGTSLRPGQCASCRIQVLPETDGPLMKGSKFFAEHICFENDAVMNLYQKDIEACLCWDGTSYTEIDNFCLQHEGRLLFYPFGTPVHEGNVCFLKLAGPLRKTGDNRLSFLAAGKYQDHRMPVKPEDHFIPLGRIALEVFTAEGWKACTIKEDTSYGLIQDGCICFENTFDMVPTVVGDTSGYFMRMVLTDCQYESSPGCAGMGLDWVEIRQKESWAVWEKHSVRCNLSQWEFVSEHSLAKNGLSEILWYKEDGTMIPAAGFQIEKRAENRTGYILNEKPEGTKDEVMLLLFEPEFDTIRFLGPGTGFPRQRYDLQTDRVLSTCFDILVEDDEYPGRFRMWTQVEDFDHSGPEDLHYHLDTDAGCLQFGDGFHGMMPEGKIVIVGYSLYMGEQGNIKAGRFGQREDMRIISHFDADGGCGNESIEAGFSRLKEALECVDRAVTAADYEQLLRRIPGLMIEACKIVSGSELAQIEGKNCDNVVGVVIKPYSDFKLPRLTENYRKNIEQYLLPRVLLGTGLKIYAPVGVRVSVYGDLVAKAQYYNAGQRIEACVQEFFEERGHRFGTPVLYADLYRELITLDCIQKIGRLTLEGRGGGAVSQANGDIYLPPYGVAVLQEMSFQIVTE